MTGVHLVAAFKAAVSGQHSQEPGGWAGLSGSGCQAVQGGGGGGRGLGAGVAVG